MARTYYLSISAAAGAAVLALEVLAARTIAPTLGSGSVTWSALLAVALAVLALGNLAGGLLSQRVPACGVIAWSLAASSACLLLLAQFYNAAMRWAADCPLVLGTIMAALIIQAVPLGMLGTVTPVILHQERTTTGRWAGLVLAAGAAGGIAGALLAGLLLLPGVGLTRSYLAVAGLLALAAVPAVWPQRRWLAAGVLLALLTAVAVCWYRHRPGAVVQSRYGQLEVRDTGMSRVLLIDGLPQTGLPAELMPGEALRCGYLLEAALFKRAKPSRALVIGLGAGLAPRLLAADGIDCQAVEIDPQVVTIARDRFGFTGRATLADGRTFLASGCQQYDLIFLDVCTSDRLAWHLFTVEALRTLQRRLSPEGVAVIQFIGDDGPWSVSLARTVDAVFGKSLMLAGRTELGPVGPRWLFAGQGLPLCFPEDYRFSRAAVPWKVVRPTGPGHLLTDDHFPAELDWTRTAVAWRRRYATLAAADD